MMPEVPELVSSVVAGAGVPGNDGSGAIAGVIAVAVAASPICGGTSIKHTNLRPSGLMDVNWCALYWCRRKLETRQPQPQ